LVFAFFVNPLQGQNYLISANIFVDMSQLIFSEFFEKAIGVNFWSFSDKVVCQRLSLNWPFLSSKIVEFTVGLIYVVELADILVHLRSLTFMTFFL
jgi:hypothetical protein